MEKPANPLGLSAFVGKSKTGAANTEWSASRYGNNKWVQLRLLYKTLVIVTVLVSSSTK